MSPARTYEWVEDGRETTRTGATVVRRILVPKKVTNEAALIPKSIRSVAPADLLKNRHLRLTWTTNDKKTFSRFMQEHKYGDNIKLKQVGELVKELGFVTANAELNDVLSKKVHNAVIYHMRRALSGVGIVYDKSVTPMKAIWPDWTLTWQSKDWTGDVSKAAALAEVHRTQENKVLAAKGEEPMTSKEFLEKHVNDELIEVSHYTKSQSPESSVHHRSRSVFIGPKKRPAGLKNQAYPSLASLPASRFSPRR